MKAEEEEKDQEEKEEEEEQEGQLEDEKKRRETKMWWKTSTPTLWGNEPWSQQAKAKEHSDYPTYHRQWKSRIDPISTPWYID